MVEVEKKSLAPVTDPAYQAKVAEARKIYKQRAANPKLIQKIDSNAVPEYTPKEYKGTLDSFDRFDVTVNIGTEFKAESGIQLSKLTDEQIADLAVLGEIEFMSK
ncbi:hypothetical protein HK096_006481, partial [Nowakowskiella sp. JEL0078]